MIDDLIRRERFAKKSDDSILHQTIQAIALNETVAKNDGDIGADFTQAMKCFLSIHEWHGQVEQDQLKRVRLATKQIECFKAGLRGDGVVTGFAQQSFDQDKRP